MYSLSVDFLRRAINGVVDLLDASACSIFERMISKQRVQIKTFFKKTI